MPTKTERILSYLPRTFQPAVRQSALRALVDAFGAELLQGENTLAAIMQAHWVDRADHGAEEIDDLARIAALYGLAPRGAAASNGANGSLCQLPPHDIETVEEFRAHLKRYVRTFLEGTVTVQGILRVAAETLGLRIADEAEELDAWWDRDDQALVTRHPRGDDAARRILGQPSLLVRGQAARAARIVGLVDLSQGIVLPPSATLRLQVDDDEPVEISLNEADAPVTASLAEIVDAINQGAGAIVAQPRGGSLILSSASIGASARLAVLETAYNAAPAILGFAPLIYQGSEAQAATVTGVVDLAGVFDLSKERYLRLVVDETITAELDCASETPASTTLAQVTEAINQALGFTLASDDGHFLTLTSPTSGVQSSIVLQQPAVQNAKTRLFGAVGSLHQGQDAQPARVQGSPDLSGGVDLSSVFNLRFRVDGAAAITVNCAGVNPANTTLQEIVDRINAHVDPDIASHDGRSVILTSPTTGGASQIALETPERADATGVILGIHTRTVMGEDATTARIIGEADLRAGVNLLAQHSLALAVDGGPATTIDLRSHAGDPGKTTPAELARAINAALKVAIATDDGSHLILASPRAGSASSLSVFPLEEVRRRRFITRAAIIDEAAPAIFGFLSKAANGTAATRAQFRGSTDLSRGVDLRTAHYLRLAVDNAPAIDIDCAGARPRATLIAEIVGKINDTVGQPIASHNGTNLILTSLSQGAQSRLTLSPPQAEDALDRLLGTAPGLTRGQTASKARFVGTVNLQSNVDLEPQAAIKLAIDDGAPVEIALAEAEPVTRSLNQLVIAINLALGVNAASHDGARLILTSATSGAASRVEFAVPTGQDVTEKVFGIRPPRIYQGEDALPAQVVGATDLSADSDLRVARFLRIGVDGGEPVSVDCVGTATDPAAVSLPVIVAAINNAIGSEIATGDGGHLVLTAPTAGFSSRIALERHLSPDARTALLGAGPADSKGQAAAPALITGELDLLAPVDLSERATLRVAVDGGQPIDINVAGAAPQATTADEMIAAINAVVPGLASVSTEGRLQLTSPSPGEESRLTLLPLRYLEVMEYPPQAAGPVTVQVRHGNAWTVQNEGAAISYAMITLANTHGVAGPALVNRTTGWRIRLFIALSNDETLHLSRHPAQGVAATIRRANGAIQRVDPAQMLIGPSGTQVLTPYDETRYLTGQPAALQLNNPLSGHLVRLRAKTPTGVVGVRVVESEPGLNLAGASVDDGQVAQLCGRLAASDGDYHLVDANGAQVAQLLAGPGIDFGEYANVVVLARGTLHQATPPLLIVQQLARLFDVTIVTTPAGGDTTEEFYPAVTIGDDPQATSGLYWQINAGPEASHWLTAELLSKDEVLALPRGSSRWLFQDCYGDRFNSVYLNQGRFAGGRCLDRAIFNVSYFGTYTDENVGAVFASAVPATDPLTAITFDWEGHRPGAFAVNLPSDLPTRYGGRFNQIRFGQPNGAPEVIEKVVTEPPEDESYIVRQVQQKSKFVVTSLVSRVPLGWEALRIPFRRPQFLTLGSADEPAQLYLAEDGFEGFIKIEASQSGAWGNDVAIAVRPAGPAMYDLCIMFAGSPFEHARQTVLGPAPAPLTQELLKPSPVGVQLAKAAGIHVTVTRDSTAGVDGE